MLQGDRSGTESATRSHERDTSMLQEDKKYFVKSYGCQMNVYDSQRMQESLVNDGFAESKDIEDAEIIILNTCHIREKAAEKLYSALGKIKKLKDKRQVEKQHIQVIVAGCVAQAQGEEILRRQPAVDIVIGPQNYHKLTEVMKRARLGGRIVETEFPVESKFDHLPARGKNQNSKSDVSAFVTIQEGCDKFCTFCVVPYTRGAEYSRPVAGILQEITELTGDGVQEVTLIGQNVNAYRGQALSGGNATLADLISAVAQIEKISRIRYTTSHPRDMSDDLIACHTLTPKLMPYLHLPVQSGSDRILNKMNRQHTAAEYIRIIASVRKLRPDIAISSDFIVGFPGETESDFQETIELVERVRFASAYSFKYSSRPGTPGSELADPISDEIKSKRLIRLQTLLNYQRQEFNEECVGRQLPVLIEKAGRYEGQVVGKTPYLQSVQLDADINMIGAIANCKITSVGTNSLFGKLIA